VARRAAVETRNLAEVEVLRQALGPQVLDPQRRIERIQNRQFQEFFAGQWETVLQVEVRRLAFRDSALQTRHVGTVVGQLLRQLSLAGRQVSENRIQGQPVIFGGGVLSGQFGDLRLQLVRRGLTLLDFRCREAGADGQPDLRLGHVPIGGSQPLGVRTNVFSTASVVDQAPHLRQHGRSQC